MTSYFLPAPSSPSLSYITTPLPSSASSTCLSQGGDDNILAATARAYLEEPHRTKRITLTRKTANWGAEYTESLIRTLLSRLQYRGHISVMFPKSHTRVVVKPPKDAEARWMAGAGWMKGISDVFAQVKTFPVEMVWPFGK